MSVPFLQDNQPKLCMPLLYLLSKVCVCGRCHWLAHLASCDVWAPQPQDSWHLTSPSNARNLYKCHLQNSHTVNPCSYQNSSSPPSPTALMQLTSHPCCDCTLGNCDRYQHPGMPCHLLSSSKTWLLLLMSFCSKALLGSPASPISWPLQGM